MLTDLEAGFNGSRLDWYMNAIPAGGTSPHFCSLLPGISLLASAFPLHPGLPRFFCSPPLIPPGIVPPVGGADS